MYPVSIDILGICSKGSQKTKIKSWERWAFEGEIIGGKEPQGKGRIRAIQITRYPVKHEKVRGSNIIMESDDYRHTWCLMFWGPAC